MVGKLVVVEPRTPSRADELFERVAGALLGGAISDALGWPTEFARRPRDLEQFGVHYPVRDFVSWHKNAGGRFFRRLDTVQPGEYSDDTQLALAVARAIRGDGTVDNDYFARQELRYWLDYARGAGATVTAAAKSASRKSADWRWNYFRFTRGRRQSDYRDAGANGAAMRVGPIALANVTDVEATYVETWKNAMVTHGHPRAILGAVIFAEAVRSVVARDATEPPDVLRYVDTLLTVAQIPRHDPDIGVWESRWNHDVVIPFEHRWSEAVTEMRSLLSVVADSRTTEVSRLYELLSAKDPALKGSGTHSVATALSIFMKFGDHFGRGALAAANELGSDTDTVGSMAGYLSGGLLGYTAIPEEWATMMADFGYFTKTAATLSQIGLREVDENPLRLGRYEAHTTQNDVLRLLESHDVRERKRVWHPFLGEGIVLKVESQAVAQGRVLLATVKFDAGQTCKFHKYLAVKPSQQDPAAEDEVDVPWSNSLSEQFVRDRFERHLTDSDWSIDRANRSSSDVVATHGDDLLIAEVKGDTGTNSGTDVDTGYGQLLRAMQLSRARFALVVPYGLLRLALRVPRAIRETLRITVYSVDDRGDVRIHEQE